MTGSLLKQHQQHIETVELHPSSGGVFEVRLDGELIFSKKALRRFPEQGEVEEILSNKVSE